MRLPGSLEEAGVPSGDLESLARDAAAQWTGNFNPRPLDEAGAMELYRWALNVNRVNRAFGCALLIAVDRRTPSSAQQGAGGGGAVARRRTSGRSFAAIAA